MGASDDKQIKNMSGPSTSSYLLAKATDGERKGNRKAGLAEPSCVFFVSP